MKMDKELMYEAPEVLVQEVEVEKGYGASVDFQQPDYQGD